MGILETTLDQIADFFGEVPAPSKLYGNLYRGRLIRFIAADDEWFFQRTDGRYGGKGDSYEDCIAQIDEEIAEDEFAGGPRNREPLTAAEQRREEHAAEAANDRAFGREDVL